MSANQYENYRNSALEKASTDLSEHFEALIIIATDTDSNGTSQIFTIHKGNQFAIEKITERVSLVLNNLSNIEDNEEDPEDGSWKDKE
jgi:hypothetical protein